MVGADQRVGEGEATRMNALDDRFDRRERELRVGRAALAQRCRTDGLERLSLQLSPERTLERGFSLTRDESGRIVRQPEQVRPGDLIATRVAGGTFKSRVEKS